MADSEFVYLLKELLVLKTTIASNDPGGFIKNLIAILPATITSIATIFGVMWAFKRNYEKDRKFKIEADEKELKYRNEAKEKELHEKLVKIYGQIVGYNYKMMNLIANINLAMINGNYISAMVTVEKEKTKISEYSVKYDKCLEDHEHNFEKLSDITEKYTAALAEYFCYFPNTNVFILYDKISKDYVYTHSKDYNDQMDRKQMDQLRDEILIGASKYVPETFSKQLKNIGDCILKETGIKTA
jgi:hypothetical protein